jgi:hypothetical protein
VPWFRVFSGKRLADGSTRPSSDNFDLLVETSASASTADRVFRIVMALAPPFAGACHAGSVILTAELIAGHVQRGGRKPRPGRSGCRRCARSGCRSGDGHQPSGHPACRIPAGGHARVRRGGAGRRGPGRQRLPGACVSLFRHHAERRGTSGRTRADPPIWPLPGGCRELVESA